MISPDMFLSVGLLHVEHVAMVRKEAFEIKDWCRRKSKSEEFGSGEGWLVGEWSREERQQGTEREESYN
jgi:hypothetical protein